MNLHTVNRMDEWGHPSIGFEGEKPCRMDMAPFGLLFLFEMTGIPSYRKSSQ